MQCAILAGGLATRMRSVSTTVPKALLPVAGRPFADLQLGWLAGQGVTDVVYCIGHLGDQIADFVGDGARWGLRVAYADEGGVLLGTAGALAKAARADLLDERFLVIYGDSHLDLTVRDMWSAFEASELPMMISVFRNDGRFDRSNVRMGARGLELYDKRVDDPAEAGMQHIDYGLSAMRRSVLLDHVPAGASHDLADIQHALSLDGLLGGFEVERRFYEIGSPSGLAELEALLRRR